jgi:hypothetical protein
VEEIFDEDQHSDAELELLPRVMVWPVRTLVGATLEVDSADDIAMAMRQLLSNRLPGPDWWVPDNWSAAFPKYPIVHRSIPAPPNSITGEAMALEVFGTAERALQPHSAESMEAQLRWLERGARAAERPCVVTFPTRITIEVATYANLAYAGVRVPFYL